MKAIHRILFACLAGIITFLICTAVNLNDYSNGYLTGMLTQVVYFGLLLKYPSK